MPSTARVKRWGDAISSSWLLMASHLHRDPSRSAVDSRVTCTSLGGSKRETSKTPNFFNFTASECSPSSITALILMPAPSSQASSKPAARTPPNGSHRATGRRTTPENPSRPVTRAALSFDVTKSAGPTETSPELLLPQISHRRSPDRSKRLIWSTLLTMVALLFAQALVLRDTRQIRLHQRDVAPELQR